MGDCGQGYSQAGTFWGVLNVSLRAFGAQLGLDSANLMLFHFLLPTFYSLLSTFYFLPSTFHFPLSTFYFLLSTFYFLLSTFYFLKKMFTQKNFKKKISNKFQKKF